MNYFSMFSGIGGFEYGIQRAIEVSEKRRGQGSQEEISRDTWEGLYPIPGEETIPIRDGDNGDSHGCINSGQPNCVGYSEIDKYASKVYERHYDHKNYGDATKINASELPDFELLVGGFPCQAFSIAGKRAGFDDTRGTLFFDIARILKEKRPRHLVLENVKGLLSHDGGRTFTTILGVLTDLGYSVEWQILNSKNFGVPQNRERVFIVGHLRGQCGRKIFPLRESDEVYTRSGEAEKEVYASTLTARQFASWNGNYIKQVNQPKHSNDRIYDPEGISPTLNTMQGGNRQPFIAAQRGRENGQQLEPRPDDNTNTLTSVSKDNYVVENPRIRKLTPIECERLQGFPDNWTAGESDSQRYKMCGNAVTTNVVQAVIEALVDNQPIDKR